MRFVIFKTVACDSKHTELLNRTRSKMISFYNVKSEICYSERSEN